MGTAMYLLTPKIFHARRHAGELGHGVAQVGDDEHQDKQDRQLDAEVLPDQVRQPFAGDHAHAGAHLLYDDQGHGDGNQCPQQVVAEVSAGDGVGGDAAGIIVHAGRDDARADDRQEQCHMLPVDPVQPERFGEGHGTLPRGCALRTMR